MVSNMEDNMLWDLEYSMKLIIISRFFKEMAEYDVSISNVKYPDNCMEKAIEYLVKQTSSTSW